MNKEQILRDSVKRLLELNIPDKEIIENLKSVGVTEDNAKRILRETKEAPSKPAPEARERDEDIYSKVYEELEGEDSSNSPVVQKQIRNPHYSSPSKSEDGISELWEKGILSTVNAKLNEMERIKADLDAMIDSRIQEHVKREVRKVETVLESQRDLFNSKVEAQLESKANEIKKVIEARAHQMEDLHAKVQAEVSRIQGEKKFNQELLNSINDKLSGLDAIRSQMISDTNTVLINMQSKFEDFMHDATEKRDEMESRINRTLQLESKITEGLIEDAKQKMEEMQLEKEGELTKRVQQKIVELDQMVNRVDPKGIVERIARLKELEDQLVKRQKEIDKHIDNRFDTIEENLKDFKKQISKIEEQNFEELRKEYGANLDELFAKQLIAWDKAIKDKRKEMDDVSKKIDVEKFNATMESLDLFKQQFVKTVEKSIQDYNKTKKELSETIMERDRKINDYLKQIDAKMRELNEFQQKFASEVSGLLDSIPEQKGEKKGKKG